MQSQDYASHYSASCSKNFSTGNDGGEMTVVVAKASLSMISLQKI